MSPFESFAGPKMGAGRFREDVLEILQKMLESPARKSGKVRNKAAATTGLTRRSSKAVARISRLREE
jgi:hypothetical protein